MLHKHYNKSFHWLNSRIQLANLCVSYRKTFKVGTQNHQFHEAFVSFSLLFRNEAYTFWKFLWVFKWENLSSIAKRTNRDLTMNEEIVNHLHVNLSSSYFINLIWAFTLFHHLPSFSCKLHFSHSYPQYQRCKSFNVSVAATIV
jgi:hypothetical protein